MNQDIEKLFKKPGEKRYDIFVKTVADTEEVFGLADEEGWALLGDDEDADIIPFFPSPDTAEAFRTAAGFEEYNVMVIDLNELMEWFDDMETDNMMVAICPNTQFNGAVVEPQKIKTDIQKEIDRLDGTQEE